MAGVIASDCCGVAKRTNIVPIKAMFKNGTGWTSDILRGLMSVYDYAVTNDINQSDSVVALSFIADDVSMILDYAVAILHELGFVVITAAGNDNTDACEVSPARSASVVTFHV